MNTSENICQYCIQLVGGSRKIRPHKFLKHIPDKDHSASSAMGSVEETYYECSKCNKKWTHETGNMGYGWL